MPKVVKVEVKWEGSVVAQDDVDARTKVKRYLARNPALLKVHTKDLGDVENVDVEELKK